LAVSFLRAKPPSINNEYAVIRNPPACETNQTLANVYGQGGRLVNIETELHGRGCLVDILPAWSSGANEFLMDFALVNRYGGRDLNHASGRSK
jgi:hypothetical protein